MKLTYAVILTWDPSEMLVVGADVDSGAGVTEQTGRMVVSILKHVVDVQTDELLLCKGSARDQF